MHGAYLWAIVVGFLAGVFARSYLSLGYAFAALFVLLALAPLFFARERGGALVIVVFLIAFSGGVARMHAATLLGDPVVTAHVGEEATIEGYVFEEPDVRDASVRIFVAADTLVTKYAKDRVHAGILVTAPPHTEVAYGDRVLAYGTLRLPERFDTGAGRQFSYPEYLAAEGIAYQLSFAQIERQRAPNEGNIFKALAIQAKEEYLRGVRAVLPEPAAGLAGGITVGDKRSIGTDLSADFQRASLIHIVVLSGYNITVVINAAARIVVIAPALMRFGIAGTIVAFFVLMSGGAASAVRAGAMALIAVYARITHRTFIASRALGVAAFGMVLYNPFTLAFDPSFQLSALATIGLIAFTPIFSQWFARVPERLGLREIVASTLATQLAVLPLLLYQNGTLSIVALPANLLALAPMPLAMLFSFIAAISGMVLGAYGTLLAAPAYLVLSYIIAVGEFFAHLPFAAITLPAFSAWWLIIAYALLFGLRSLYMKKRPAKPAS